MRISKTSRGSTIAEAMIVLLVVTAGVTGTYQMLQGGVKLASATESRIQAINLAREGIEAMENVRNTNWTKFSSDLENCFDVADYNGGCVGSPSVAKLGTGTPKILINQNGMWHLTGSVSTWSGVVYGPNGFSDQGWGDTLPICNSSRPTNCRSKFFRTVTVDDIGTAGAKKMRVTSTVTWRDSSRAEPHKITLEEVLTNWKANF